MSEPGPLHEQQLARLAETIERVEAALGETEARLTPARRAQAAAARAFEHARVEFGRFMATTPRMAMRHPEAQAECAELGRRLEQAESDCQAATAVVNDLQRARDRHQFALRQARAERDQLRARAAAPPAAASGQRWLAGWR